MMNILEIKKLIEKLIKLANKCDEIKEIAKTEAKGRSLLIYFTDAPLPFYIYIDKDGELKLTHKVHDATCIAYLDIKTFVDILHGKIRPAWAYAHGLIKLIANDGRPYYHFVLLNAYFNRFTELIQS